MLIKPMKLSSLAQSILVLVASGAVVSYAVAGQHEGRRSGPGFTSDNNPGVLGRTAKDGRGGLFNSQNNPGVLGSEFGRTTASGVRSTQPAAVFGQGTIGADNRTQAVAAASRREHNKGHQPLTIPGVGVSPIPSATPGGTHSAPSPIPSATPAKPGKGGFPGVSPIPSATPGGTHSAPSPIPSATPGGTHSAPSPIPSATPGGR